MIYRLCIIMLHIIYILHSRSYDYDFNSQTRQCNVFLSKTLQLTLLLQSLRHLIRGTLCTHTSNVDSKGRNKRELNAKYKHSVKVNESFVEQGIAGPSFVIFDWNLPIFLYSARTWAILEQDLNKLKVVQMQCLC